MQLHVDPLLMNAHALPVDSNEPHARAGNHLRVSSHPLLGLPVTPFIVYRASPDNRKTLVMRTTATYIDDVSKQQLIPPFSMLAGQSVTVTIRRDLNEHCIWANLIAQGEEVNAGGEGRPEPVNPLDIPALSGRPGFDLLSDSIPLTERVLADRVTARQARGFRVQAYMASATGRGPAVVGCRSTVPFAFSAPDIVQLRIQGAGTVFGIEWIEARESQKLDYQPYSVMCLPHTGGPRYLPINNPITLAATHTSSQAPERLPLQETSGIPAPATAPVATVAQELQRVASLTSVLGEDLESLLVDTSEEQLEQMVIEVVTDADGNVLTDVDGNPAGSSRTSRLQRVLGALADPGTATGIGYKLRDNSFTDVEDRIVFYRVYGFFEDVRAGTGNDLGVDPARLQPFDSALGSVDADGRQLNGNDVFERYTKLVSNLPFGQPVSSFSNASNNRSYVMLQTHAIADVLAPLDQPESAQITDTIHKSWLPAPPPNAPREVEVLLADVRVTGLLAAAKRTPAASGSFKSLNRENADGFHLPIALASNIDDETSEPADRPGVGFIADRTAAASAIDYAVAQQDRFGRWSQWTRRVANAGPRPRPPRPVVQAYYRQPSIADAAISGGRITVFVAVPDANDLAPGSLKLKHVRVFIEDPVAANQQHDLLETAKVPVTNQTESFRVELSIDGPRLALMEQRRVTVSAIWFDQDDRQSVKSENVRLNLVDPRAPAQLTVPPDLLYAARPDVTGLAWIEHRWSAQSGVSYGVYYSDENRLRAYLEEQDESTLLAQISSADDAAIRADVYRNNANLFPDYLFERLNDVVVDFADSIGFRHAVSGSLRVFSVYKIAVESESGAKPELRDLPIILYGVPNSDPPQQPTLAVEPVELPSGEADYRIEVNITVLAGTTEASTWRLRRTRTDTSKLSAMPIVATGDMGLPTETGQQQASYIDDGSVLIAETAKLTPWTRYAYRVEVQGAPENGSSPPVPGRWSAASEPVTLVLIPDDVPSPPALEALNGNAAPGGEGLTDVTLTLSHPQRLSGGISGYYTVRIDRRIPGGVLETLGEHDIVQPDEPLTYSGVIDASPNEIVPSGTTYIVTLSDPLGRSAVPLTVPVS